MALQDGINMINLVGLESAVIGYTAYDATSGALVYDMDKVLAILRGKGMIETEILQFFQEVEELYRQFDPPIFAYLDKQSIRLAIDESEKYYDRLAPESELIH